MKRMKTFQKTKSAAMVLRFMLVFQISEGSGK